MKHTLASSLILSTCFAMTGLLSSSLVLGGCSESRDEKMATAATGLYTTSASVTKLKIDVNKTNGVLQRLKGGAGGEAEFALLKEQIAAIKENAAFIKASHEQMMGQTDAVVAKWDEEIAAVQDPVLKASATQRSANMRESVTQIAADFGTAKAAYLPYISSLDELVKFLDNDRTPSGVKVAVPAIDNSVQAGIAVQTEINKLSAKLDALSGEIAPAAK